jgi:hypothetical protein
MFFRGEYPLLYFVVFGGIGVRRRACLGTKPVLRRLWGKVGLDLTIVSKESAHYFFCIFFAGLQNTVSRSLLCLCRPFCFLRDVWTRTQRSSIATRRLLRCHYFSESRGRSCNCSLRDVAIIHMTLRGPMLGSEHACLPASPPPPPRLKEVFPW